MPLDMAIEARVMMKAWMPKKVTPIPLTMPTAVPTASAAASAPGTPASVVTVIENMIPTRARIDPTERSMPEVRTTNVMPTATTPVMDACRATLVRFWVAKNTGARKNVSTSMMAKRMRMTL